MVAFMCQKIPHIFLTFKKDADEYWARRAQHGPLERNLSRSGPAFRRRYRAQRTGGDVHRAVPSARLIEVTRDPVGLTDVADIAGVSTQNMRKLMLAHPRNFPASVREGSASIRHPADVLAWLQAMAATRWPGTCWMWRGSHGKLTWLRNASGYRARRPWSCKPWLDERRRLAHSALEPARTGRFFRWQASGLEMPLRWACLRCLIHAFPLRPVPRHTARRQVEAERKLAATHHFVDCRFSERDDLPQFLTADGAGKRHR